MLSSDGYIGPKKICASPLINVSILDPNIINRIPGDLSQTYPQLYNYEIFGIFSKTSKFLLTGGDTILLFGQNGRLTQVRRAELA